MSHEGFVDFLSAARDSSAVLARYSQRNIAQVVYHAKLDGFDFSTDDMADVIGILEANVIVNKDRDPFDGTSRLWRSMWGVSFLDYLVNHVVRRHTSEELRSLIKRQQWGGA